MPVFGTTVFLRRVLRTSIALVATILLSACASTGAKSAANQDEQAPNETSTQLVVLGTGTPNPDPDRMGSGLAIVAGGQPYLVDCGAGVVRRAAEAGLPMTRLTRLFITHLHSDHTLGYADVMLTPWVLEREHPLEVFGPRGTQAMTDNLLAAYSADIDNRLYGPQPQNATGIQVDVHEIEPGEIYADENVTVTSFAVQHGSWDHAFGYRFDAADRSIVVSGDTVATEAVIAACNGCDVLVHEVYAKWGLDRRTTDWQAYHRASHTSGVELGLIAAKARPKLLVLYHQLLWGATEEQLISEIRQNFDGEIAFADDLDVY